MGHDLLNTSWTTLPTEQAWPIYQCRNTLHSPHFYSLWAALQFLEPHSNSWSRTPTAYARTIQDILVTIEMNKQIKCGKLVTRRGCRTFLTLLTSRSSMNWASQADVLPTCFCSLFRIHIIIIHLLHLKLIQGNKSAKKFSVIIQHQMGGVFHLYFQATGVWTKKMKSKGSKFIPEYYIILVTENLLYRYTNTNRCFFTTIFLTARKGASL